MFTPLTPFAFQQTRGWGRGVWGSYINSVQFENFSMQLQNQINTQSVLSLSEFVLHTHRVSKITNIALRDSQDQTQLTILKI